MISPGVTVDPLAGWKPGQSTLRHPVLRLLSFCKFCSLLVLDVQFNASNRVQIKGRNVQSNPWIDASVNRCNEMEKPTRSKGLPLIWCYDKLHSLHSLSSSKMNLIYYLNKDNFRTLGVLNKKNMIIVNANKRKHVSMENLRPIQL
jgi:hypothetical protein